MNGNVIISNCRAGINNSSKSEEDGCGGFAFLGGWARIDAANKDCNLIIRECRAGVAGGGIYVSKDIRKDCLIELGGTLRASLNSASWGSFYYSSTNKAALYMKDNVRIYRNTFEKTIKKRRSFLRSDSPRARPFNGANGAILSLQDSPVYIAGSLIIKDNEGGDLILTDNSLHVVGDLGKDAHIGINGVSNNFQASQKFASTKKHNYFLEKANTDVSSSTWSGYTKAFHNNRNTSLKAYEVAGQSSIEWRDAEPLCKVIDGKGNPHPFASIRDAITYVKTIGDDDTSNHTSKDADGIRIEMIKGLYKITDSSSASPNADNFIFENIDKKIILTSAKHDAKDGYPLQPGGDGYGATSRAVVQRNCSVPENNVGFGGLLIIDNSTVETRDIVFDGNGDIFYSASGGNIVVQKGFGSIYHMQEGTTIRGATCMGSFNSHGCKGGAIYATGGSKQHESKFYMYSGAKIQDCKSKDSGQSRSGTFSAANAIANFDFNPNNSNDFDVNLLGGEISHCSNSISTYEDNLINIGEGINLLISGDTFIHDNYSLDSQIISLPLYSDVPITIQIDGSTTTEGVRIINNTVDSIFNLSSILFGYKNMLVSSKMKSPSFCMLYIQGKVRIHDNISKRFKRDCSIPTPILYHISPPIYTVVSGELDPSSRISVWDTRHRENRCNGRGAFATTNNVKAKDIKNLAAFKNAAFAHDMGISLDESSFGTAGKDNEIVWGSVAKPVQLNVAVDQEDAADHWFIAQVTQKSTGHSIRIPFMVPARRKESEPQTLMISPLECYDFKLVSSHDNWLYVPNGTAHLYPSDFFPPDGVITKTLTLNKKAYRSICWSRDEHWASLRF